ncbi:MAG: hypothetical protein KatS3mg002_0555 [Candidatus Woesearchaeota archaeon]|nr:MAG: hypothetical protein KatS3mg002_0555 [Candidatus Woesearchaeota archaeon]
MRKLLLLLFLLLSFSVYAVETECPFGLVNDTAPGQCARYVDTNYNEICDLSEPYNCTTESSSNNPDGIELSGTQLKEMTVEEVANTYNISPVVLANELGKILNTKVYPKDSLQLLHDNNALGMSQVKEVAYAIKNNIKNSSDNNVKKSSRTKYYLIPIVIISTIAYFITFFLSKKNIITLIMHRKIWNWLLLVFFVFTTFFALIWLLNAEYGLGIRLPINTSYWHVITGIVMIIISIFHILWHLNYYFVKKV